MSKFLLSKNIWNGYSFQKSFEYDVVYDLLNFGHYASRVIMRNGHMDFVRCLMCFNTLKYNTQMSQEYLYNVFNCLKCPEIHKFVIIVFHSVNG